MTYEYKQIDYRKWQHLSHDKTDQDWLSDMVEDCFAIDTALQQVLE